MAELGVAGSILGCVALGAKVALSLYKFSDSIQSARSEIVLLGQEISLFCTALKEIHVALESREGPAQFSQHARETIGAVTTRCTEVFREIEGILEKVGKGRGGEGGVQFGAGVRYLFKRPRVQLLRGTLDSMKLTLQLMLTTLDFSQKLYANQNTSGGPIELKAEVEEAQDLVETLVISHQVALEDLHEKEEQCAKEYDQDEDLDTPTSQSGRSKSEKDSATEDKRASVFLATAASDYDPSCAGSIASNVTAQSRDQTFVLAGRWTSSNPSFTRPQATHGRNMSAGVIPSKKSGHTRSDLGDFLLNIRPGAKDRKPNSPQAIAPTSKPTVASNSSSNHSQTRDTSGSSPSSPQHKPLPRSPYQKSPVPSAPATGLLANTSVPRSFEKWDSLSSHWECLTADWLRKLEQSADEVQGLPLTMQMSRQITDLSAAGINFFQTVTKMQRLREALEGRVQSWSYEHQQEQERGQQREAQLQMEVMKLKQSLTTMDKGDSKKLEEELQRQNVEIDRQRDEIKQRETQIKVLWQIKNKTLAIIKEKDQEIEDMRVQREKDAEDMQAKREEEQRETTRLVDELQVQLKFEQQQRLNVVHYLTGSSESDTPISANRR